MNDSEIAPEDIPFKGSDLAELIALIDKGTISGSIAKKVLKFMFEDGSKSPEQIVKEKGMIQVSDEGAIKDIIANVLASNEKSVADYKSGKKNAVGFLVGQCMKASRGQANPQMVNKLLTEMLDNM
jgi:aspartyl-tRNA(Asn)/glutamyl-tRNA(Gln) amidotransferase subunit B